MFTFLQLKVKKGAPLIIGHIMAYQNPVDVKRAFLVMSNFFGDIISPLNRMKPQNNTLL